MVLQKVAVGSGGASLISLGGRVCKKKLIEGYVYNFNIYFHNNIHFAIL
jgi:hypothetical protein